MGLLTVPAPGGVAAGFAAATLRLLPVNVVLQAGTGKHAVYLDSHALFGVEPLGAAPRSWQQVMFCDKWDSLQPSALQVTLQAVRVGA